MKNARCLLHSFGWKLRFFCEGLSGVLSESAMALITRILPQPSLADRRDGLLRACTHALSRGITSVVDFGAYIPGVPAEQSWNDLRGFNPSRSSKYISLMHKFSDV